MTTPSSKIEPTQISDEDLKDTEKSMSRRISSAFKKSFSKTMKRRTPSKTYIFNKEGDFKDKTKFSNSAGVAPNNTVIWSIILKIDPANINPKIIYTHSELKAAVTRVLKIGKTLDRKFGENTASDKRNEKLAELQKKARETYLNEKSQHLEIRKALEKQDSKNADDVIDEIQLSIDADESKKNLTARLKQLHEGGQSRRRRRRKRFR